MILEQSGELSGEQKEAMNVLRLGKSMAEAARTSGVGRATVYRWVRNDAYFRAAYNEWRNEMDESATARLAMLSDRAADALEKALEKGDVRVGLQLLKGMGLMRPWKRRLSEGQELERRTSVARQKRQRKLEKTERQIALDDKTSRYADRMVDEMLLDERTECRIEKGGKKVTLSRDRVI